jgi:type 1 fimbriae regulatory protein FimB/type 1 fimbriae regulatory protein FimE
MRTSAGSAAEKRTVVPFPGKRGPHKRGDRPYLTPAEVEALMAAARKRGRYGQRDATMILTAYRHGLRVSELVALRWSQIDLDAGRVRVVRLKGSDDSLQPLSGAEIRALRKIRRGQPADASFVFVTERGSTMTPRGFQLMMDRAAESIGMADVHPHLLRHGTGYKLVNDGVDTRTLAAYLGHRNMQHTMNYTKMSSTRFNGLWQD